MFRHLKYSTNNVNDDDDSTALFLAAFSVEKKINKIDVY